jgi:EmrB/QacA subfamily drug resistance transporter
MNVRSSDRADVADTAVGTLARGPGFGLILMLCAQFMVLLDSSIVTVAIPDIQHHLGFSPADVQLVITAYNTTFGGALILFGRLGDLFGRRRMFIAGMLGFALTSLLCAVSQNAVMLITFRALQGLSAAMIAPTALALLVTSAPEGPARVKAMSKFGIATVLGFISGLVFSGLLVKAWGWQGVFYATVPFGVLVAVFTPRFIRAVGPLPRKVDVVGAVLITVSVALIVTAPAQGATAGWSSGRFVTPLVTGVALLAAFLWYETRLQEPLIRLGLFRSPVLRSANVASLMSGIMTGSTYLLVTTYLQDALGFSPLKAGLIVAPVGALNVAYGFVIGRLITRLGLRLSVTIATAGAGLLIGLTASQVAVGENLLVFAIVLLPMGMAFMSTTVTSALAATTGVANHEQGLAAGIRQTSFQFGIAVGVAALLPLATSLARSRAASVGHAAALADGIQIALFALSAAAVVIGVAIYFGMRQASKPRAAVSASAGDAAGR